MPKCENCGKDNAEGQKFCVECGKPITASSVCSKCGKKLVLDAKFCVECGAPVKGNFSQTSLSSVKENTARIVVDSQGMGDFKTITEALEKAEDGAEIIVKAGEYNEHFVVSKKVSIIGEMKGKERPIVWDIYENTPVGIMITADASIKNIEVYSTSKVDHNSIDFSNGKLYAAVLIKNSSATLENMVISDWFDDGIDVSGKSSKPEIKKCEIKSHSGVGIRVLGNASPTIVGCDIHHVSEHGIDTQGCSSVTVQDCKIRKIGWTGIRMTDSSTGSIECCEVYDCEKSGLLVTENTEASIKNCNIHDCEVCAILVSKNSTSRIEKCDLSRCKDVLFCVKMDSDANIFDSAIHDTLSNGILIVDSKGTINSCEVYKCDKKGSMVVFQNANAKLSGCNIHEAPKTSGVSISGSSVGVVENCNIFNCLIDVFANEDSNCEITNSTLQDFDRFGINILGNAVVKISGSEICVKKNKTGVESVMAVHAESDSAECLLEDTRIYAKKINENYAREMDAVYIYGNTKVTLNNCKIENAREGMVFVNASKVVVENCVIDNTYDMNVINAESANIVVKNCKVYNSVGIVFDSYQSTIEVTDCLIDGCDNVAHTELTGNSSITLNNCSLKNCKRDSSDDKKVHLNNAVIVREIKIKGRDSTYNTIGEALEAASDGDTILIPAEEYNESVTIDKNVSLVGIPENGKEAPVIWCDTTQKNAVIVIESECTLSNLEVKGAKEEFFCSYSYPKRPDDVKVCDWWPKCIYVKSKCTLSNLKAYYSAGHGIVCGADASLEMKDCSAYGNSRMGLLGIDGAAGTITNCDFFKNHLSGLSFGDETTISVVDCLIHENFATGVICFNASPTVEGCKICENKYDGVCIREKADCIVKDCEIGKNSFGIHVESDGKGDVDGCDIVGNSKTGIWVENAFSSIRNCEIHDGKSDGISFTKNSQGVVENCNIYANAKEPINVSSDSKPIIKNNKVAGLESDDDCED